MTRYLVEELGVFENDPIVICDVGARGGFEPQWQVFSSQACSIGFEPDPIEFARLQDSLSSATDRIYPLALGKQRERRLFSICRHPGGSSFYPADLHFIERFPPEYAQELTVTQTLEVETVSLDEFVRDYQISTIDFLKLDTEGSELDILQGARNILQNSVLGLSLEVLFHSSMRQQPTFSDIDRFLQAMGFQLFDLEIYRHARRALPRPMSKFGNTDIGQVLWGQALYLRDGVAEIDRSNSSDCQPWHQTRILKLASLMEIFTLPDCALELIRDSTAFLDRDLQTSIERAIVRNVNSLTEPAMNIQSADRLSTAPSHVPQPRGYAQRFDCLSAAELQHLAQTITTSPYLAASQLSTNFQGSRGFSVIFTRSGIDRVKEHFPGFAPYLDKALKSACNAFYLNPLLLDEGMGVEPHVDCSISSYDMVLTIPKIVSVLYVQVPEDTIGGELILRTEQRLIGTIVPQTNKLVYFVGQLLHSVNPVHCSSSRISLICEQYHLSEDRLKNIPEFEIKSAAKKY
ncbi:FkbM family methyltransferase [Chamaesiphon minutus]|nr:FkbM family methyltransferase [Chamaesiphon minutus]